MMDVADWLGEYLNGNYAWCAKRLSGNDTLASKAHQAGPYLPKPFVFELFPEVDRKDVKNPDTWVDLYIDSHPDARRARVVYYNTRKFEQKSNGRNETRITNLGGAASALLDPDSTGALTVFAFALGPDGTASEAHIWVCRHETEEDVVEDRIGPVEPASFVTWTPRTGAQQELFPVRVRAGCFLALDEIPPAWLVSFPTGAEIIAKAAELQPRTGLTPDKRLMKRRECEYALFQSLEEAVELPKVRGGFGTVKEFLDRAQSVLQRRKSRAGRSLELHTRQILLEERFVQGVNFDHQKVSELGKKPDFIFPSQAAYQDSDYHPSNLRILAVKTTLKDRWRQITTEADRIPTKHLLTLQRGISDNQFKEMIDKDVKLVVPEDILESFHKSIRPHIQTLESFIAEVRVLPPR